MPHYVDAFVVPVPKSRVDSYRRLSRRVGKVWREHGALEYRECLGDDLSIKGVMPFPRGIRAKRGEVVFFGWILYRSRAHRDRVNKKVMEDPRMGKMMESTTPPFDPERMLYGGFRVLVDV